MYIPRHFSVDDQEQLGAFIDGTAIATLITAGPRGLIANQAPLLRQPEANRLWGHFARPNPQLEELASVAEVLVQFSGPSGYVSPNWYADPGLVPTWNFVSVQVRGRAVIHDDPGEVLDIVRRLSDKHEASFPVPWRIDKVDPVMLEKMLGVIVGFHIEMDEVIGKYKLSQNRSAEDRAGVIAGFEQQGNSAMAHAMREREDG